LGSAQEERWAKKLEGLERNKEVMEQELDKLRYEVKMLKRNGSGHCEAKKDPKTFKVLELPLDLWRRATNFMSADAACCFKTPIVEDWAHDMIWKLRSPGPDGGIPEDGAKQAVNIEQATEKHMSIMQHMAGETQHLEAILQTTVPQDSDSILTMSQAYQRHAQSLQSFLAEFSKLGDEHPQADVLKQKVVHYFELVKRLKDRQAKCANGKAWTIG